MEGDPPAHGIDRVHVWSYRSLLDALPTASWLVKHNPPALEQSLPRQIWWQYRRLSDEARGYGCDILLSTDAGSVCRFRPGVVISQDMLSYEPGEMDRYGFSKARLRLVALRYVQNSSLRFADGVIFLTNYAATVIQRHTGKLPRVAVVPHGVGDAFKRTPAGKEWPAGGDIPIECLYVSNAAMYKHQWNVVKAIGELRRRGHNLRLTLAGGGSGKAQQLLDAEIVRTDPEGKFVVCLGHVPPENIPGVLAGANLFIFASSCENMPNTLLEAMAHGLPIACSQRGPMPEVLEDSGVMFDPENAISVADGIEKLIVDPALRSRCAARAKTLAERYSWSRCGRETWEFLLATASGGNR